jgi:hypothetical protein
MIEAAVQTGSSARPVLSDNGRFVGADAKNGSSNPRFRHTVSRGPKERLN